MSELSAWYVGACFLMLTLGWGAGLLHVAFIRMAEAIV